MSKSFRLPKTYTCIQPDCEAPLVRRNRHEFICLVCGDIRDEAAIIEHVMREQGVVPGHDWDDNL